MAASAESLVELEQFDHGQILALATRAALKAIAFKVAGPEVHGRIIVEDLSEFDLDHASALELAFQTRLIDRIPLVERPQLTPEVLEVEINETPLPPKSKPKILQARPPKVKVESPLDVATKPSLPDKAVGKTKPAKE